MLSTIASGTMHILITVQHKCYISKTHARQTDYIGTGLSLSESHYAYKVNMHTADSILQQTRAANRM